MQWILYGEVDAVQCSGCYTMQWMLYGEVDAVQCSGCCTVQWMLYNAVDAKQCINAVESNDAVQCSDTTELSH